MCAGCSEVPVGPQRCIDSISTLAVPSVGICRSSVWSRNPPTSSVASLSALETKKRKRTGGAAPKTLNSRDEHETRGLGNVSLESEMICFPSYGIGFYFEQLKLLLMSACVLVAEQRSGGAHFSQRRGCGTASMSGI